MPTRFSTPRRKFSLRRLLFAGAIASLGLPLGQSAYGIGGSAIQAAYTPRESVGATPSINLVAYNTSTAMPPAGGSGSESVVQNGGSPNRPRHVSSEDEGQGTTAKRRRAHKASEEGGATRVAKSEHGGTTVEAKDARERKDVKDAIVAPPSKPLITLSTGYESRYIYHGVDIVGFNSNLPTVDPGFPDKPLLSKLTRLAEPKADLTSPVAYINANIEFKGLHFGVGYLNATNETIPSRVLIANRAISYNRIYNTLQSPALTADLGVPTNFNFPVKPYDRTKKYYKEVDINLDYTLGIIANVLDVTAGYNSYIIPDHDFKGTNYQGEAFGRITYKQIPYVQPSITYFRYVSDAESTGFFLENRNKPVPGFPGGPLSGGAGSNGFVVQHRKEYLNGNYVEARIDGSIPLFTSDVISATLAPYVLVSLNDNYLTKQVGNAVGHTEFSTFETGFKLPVTIKEHYTITPYFNYGYDISKYHVANDFGGKIAPFKEDVWGGVTISYHF